MIIEHALLPVRPDATADFEAAFAEARHIISAMPGFRGLSLSHCVERPGTYLLLVEWDRLSDHTEGFRGSPEYLRWKELLHHFYDPFPEVWHFDPVSSVPDPTARPGVTASTAQRQ
ncbi:MULTISPECIES: antibiotic biosynthesis monooxygenase [unclassified Nocardia]|uniref:antibiotic biosynthesis monooxygenase family protein n=1 Tax=unclassified Nocardia TaxID=2637762 RepID=UPI001CE46DB8|nr:MULTISPECIES: antibiotic biosynthesis monooxygenase [unclassified Nocardia]